MTTEFLPNRSRSLLELPTPIAMASFGASEDSKLIDERLDNMRKLLSEPVATLKRVVDVTATGNTTDQLQRKLTALKQMTANIAMHLDPAWRKALFLSLDSL